MPLSLSSSPQNRLLWIFVLLAALVNGAGLPLPFLTDDEGLYALLARGMVERGDYLTLLRCGEDWLDKPHFPFWCVALSFRWLGVTTFAYKLPGVLFFFVGVAYTYRLGRLLYGLDVARWATLLLLTALHSVISNFDVRAEPYLVGLLAGSVYYVVRLDQQYRHRYVVALAALTAAALMTKGLFTALVPAGAVLGQALGTGQWQRMAQRRWWAVAGLTLLLLTPELYALYRQFDARPDNVVFGQRGVSGIGWFLWGSQFGRFFNTSYITRSDGSVWFYTHTLLWTFAPWGLLFWYALLRRAGQLWQRQPLRECYVLGAAGPMLLAFSLSGFQLPFYANILFPFFSLLVAATLHEPLTGRAQRWLQAGQWLYTALTVVVMLGISALLGEWRVGLLLGLGLCLGTYFLWQTTAPGLRRNALLSALTATALGGWLNGLLYPTVLQYRMHQPAAQFANERFPQRPVALLSPVSAIFQFYIQQPACPRPLSTLGRPAPGELFLADQPTLDTLRHQRARVRVLARFPHYPSENIKWPFLNPATRASTFKYYFLLEGT